jgi:cell division transport system ATP-binding protein
MTPAHTPHDRYSDNDPAAAAMPGASRAVVSFENVGLSYGGQALPGKGSPAVHSKIHHVLKNVNFQLNEGSFHFLTGPSGAGKTSLMKMIYLAQTPTEGRISLFGKPVHAHDRDTQAQLRREIGIVFQDFRLLPHLNVFDNAALPLFVAGQKPADFSHDVNELLAWVGLKNHLATMPDVLSGGEKQRLAIARAVVNRPTLILADEPTGNIDYAMGLRIMRLFLELNRLGATVLIATHDESLIRSTGMPVLELRKGEIIRRDLREDLGSHYGSAVYGRLHQMPPSSAPVSDVPEEDEPDASTAGIAAATDLSTADFGTPAFDAPPSATEEWANEADDTPTAADDLFNADPDDAPDDKNRGPA